MAWRLAFGPAIILRRIPGDGMGYDKDHDRDPEQHREHVHQTSQNVGGYPHFPSRTVSPSNALEVVHGLQHGVEHIPFHVFRRGTMVWTWYRKM